MPIDTARFEQFFRRNSSGDWVYVGYGPDIFGRVVSSYDREWLLGVVGKLSQWKRLTVALFSAPLTWLCAASLNSASFYPFSLLGRWVRHHFSELAVAAITLLALFLVGTALLALHPLAREFGRLLSKLPKDEPIGIERFMRNLGAVNGPWATLFLMSGFGALFLPGTFRGETWPYFSLLSALWLFCAWHSLAGAFWRARPEDF